MDKTLVNFKGSYMLVIFAIIFSMILMYIDAKFYHKELTRRDYLKLSLVVGIISTVIVYIHNIKGRVDEEIINSSPPF